MRARYYEIASKLAQDCVAAGANPRKHPLATFEYDEDSERQRRAVLAEALGRSVSECAENERLAQEVGSNCCLFE